LQNDTLQGLASYAALASPRNSSVKEEGCELVVTDLVQSLNPARIIHV
jgi:hypothetical protein